MKRIVAVIVLGLLATLSPAWAACNSAGNLVGNDCDFDAAGDVSNWTIESADSCVFNGADGSNAVGNLECNAFFSSALGRFQVRVSYCASGATGATDYNYGVDARLVSALGSPPSCNVRLIDFTGAGCTSNIDADNPVTYTPVSGSYTQSPAANYVVGAGTTTVRLEVECISGPPAPSPDDFTIRLDDAFIGVGLVPVELEQFSVESGTISH
jgi:hypothetical protein